MNPVKKIQENVQNRFFNKLRRCDSFFFLSISYMYFLKLFKLADFFDVHFFSFLSTSFEVGNHCHCFPFFSEDFFGVFRLSGSLYKKWMGKHHYTK